MKAVRLAPQRCQNHNVSPDQGRVRASHRSHYLIALTRNAIDDRRPARAEEYVPLGEKLRAAPVAITRHRAGGMGQCERNRACELLD